SRSAHPACRECRKPRTSRACGPPSPCACRAHQQRLPQACGGETMSRSRLSGTVDPRGGARHLGERSFHRTQKTSMPRTVPPALVAATLAACTNFSDIRGFAPAPGAVDKLEVGTQSREDVQRLIGSPSAVATFNPNVWYYISEKQESW